MNGGRLQRRGIAEQHHDVAVIGQSLKGATRCLDRIGRTAWLLLDDDTGRPDGFGRLLVSRSGHHDDAFGPDRLGCGDHVIHHGPADNRVHGLGQVRFHARAPSCREHDHGDILQGESGIHEYPFR